MTVMDYTAIFDYASQPKEYTVCNLCESEYQGKGGWTGGWRDSDRYGYSIGVGDCSCGLVWLNPRMTKEAYAKFYQGPYRALVSAFHGREINAHTIQPEQREYAQKLGDLLKPYIDKRMPLSLLDVGGSTGIVASVIGSRYKISGTVLDPCEAELKEAMKKGLTTVLGTIEEFEPGRKYDLILLCQSIDHLLDISGALTKIERLLNPGSRACLVPGGLFFVDIVDFDVTKQLKIDHPFNLTPKTMKAYLDKTGFKVLQEQRAKDGVHVGYVCEAA